MRNSVFVALALMAGAASAQDTDSLRFYRLSEIVVSTGASAESSGTKVRDVPLADIARLDAPSAAGLVRLIPSAHLQTNSRGEALVYVRNAGERQTAVFLDGALLTVPWDNRVDLSMLPASVLGGASVVQGGASVAYGANTLGGVVNLRTRDLEAPGALSEIGIRGGSGAYRDAHALHLRQTADWTFLAAAGSARQDAEVLSGGARLPFSQFDEEERTNSDRRMTHGVVRAGRRVAGGSLAVTLFHADARKGVAPEGHLDPAVESVRYWRYPVWKTTKLITSYRWENNARSVSGAMWGSRFRQQIDDFPTAQFLAPEARQHDEDDTAGMRWVGEAPLAGGAIRLAVSGVVSEHRQVDEAWSAAAGWRAPARQRYLQRTGSAGLEYERRVSSGARFSAGAALDAQRTPRTGDKPARDPSVAWSATVGGSAPIGPGVTLRFNAGRKVRFPSMRELFGTALNRFLVNDDLRPESALLFEAGLVVRRSSLGGEIAVFGNRTFDTIDQLNVIVDGSRLRQRINLDGSSVLGLEVLGRARPAQQIEIEGHATLTRSRVLGSDQRDRPTEKPSLLVGSSVSLEAPFGWVVALDGQVVGGARGLAPDNELVGLGTSVRLGGRLAWRRYLARSGVFSEVFFRADNVTNAAHFAQLGLPSPGRTLRFGLNLSR